PVSPEGFRLPLAVVDEMPVNPEGFRLPLVVVDEMATYRSDLRLSEKSFGLKIKSVSQFYSKTLLTIRISSLAYVEQLKELISDKNFNAVKFYKNLNFPFARKKEAEEVLYESLKIIASENNVKARKLLANFDKLINANSVVTYWD
ncbi:13472_t:CDS:2, partial [Ambispora leptoticha]